MTRIVCVHGIGQEYLGPHQLLAAWLPALRDGLQLAGATDPLDPGSVSFAFYGHIFRPEGTKGLARPLAVDDLAPGTEQELLRALAQAAGREPADPSYDTKATTPVSLQWCAKRLLSLPFMSGIAERALVLWIKQVASYLRDQPVRDQMQDIVREAIGETADVVVAHSLGSVVAYDVLASLQGSTVTGFITLGSPLGIRPTIYDQLAVFGDEGPPRESPASFQKWVNIADKRDPVALEKRLSQLFTRVEDKLVDNGAMAHSAAPYLSSRITGSAILSMLGGSTRE